MWLVLDPLDVMVQHVACRMRIPIYQRQRFQEHCMFLLTALGSLSPWARGRGPPTNQPANQPTSRMDVRKPTPTAHTTCSCLPLPAAVCRRLFGPTPVTIRGSSPSFRIAALGALAVFPLLSAIILPPSAWLTWLAWLAHMAGSSNSLACWLRWPIWAHA